MSNIVLYSTLSETLVRANLACKSCSLPFSEVKPSKLDCIHNLCMSCLTDFRCSICTNPDRKIAVGDLSKSLRVMEVKTLWQARGSNAQSAVSSTSQPPFPAETTTLQQKECVSHFYDTKYLRFDGKGPDEGEFKYHPHEWIFFRNGVRALAGFLQIKGGNHIVDDDTLNYYRFIALVNHLKLKCAGKNPDECKFYINFVDSEQAQQKDLQECAEALCIKNELTKEQHGTRLTFYPLIETGSGEPYPLTSFEAFAPFEPGAVVPVNTPNNWSVLANAEGIRDHYLYAGRMQLLDRIFNDELMRTFANSPGYFYVYLIGDVAAGIALVEPTESGSFKLKNIHLKKDQEQYRDHFIQQFYNWYFSKFHVLIKCSGYKWNGRDSREFAPIYINDLDAVAKDMSLIMDELDGVVSKK